MQSISIFAITGVLLAGSVAAADDTPASKTPGDTDAATGTPEATSPPTPPSEGLPPPRSSHDEAPPVAAPASLSGGIVSQAGVGGNVGYGRPGVLELGGSAGFTFADNYRNISVSPSLGWFVANNLELSGILSVSYAKAGDPGMSATIWSALIEPSYHYPFNRTMFAFLGVGAGLAYGTGVGTGFALAPRIGANFMIGRSGILSPYLSYQYTSHSSDTSGDVTLVAVSTQTRFNVGYTVMW